MQYQAKVEKTSNVERKLIITVDAKEIERELERQLLIAQKDADLKGFRKGHVPLNVIKQKFGDECRHRVFHQVVDDSLRNAIIENKLRVIGNPKLDLPHDHGAHSAMVAEGKDLQYSAIVEILPEITLKKYKGLSISKPKLKVSDKDVDQVIEQYRDSQAQLTPVLEDRAAKKGDFADIEFDGGVVNGASVEKRDDMKGQRVIEIGSNQLIPGFEDQLVGLKSGSSKTFRLKMPKEDLQLGGKELEFAVKLNGLKKKDLPELNEDFFKPFGFKDLADMKVKTRERLEKAKEDESTGKMKENLFEELIKSNPVDVPQSLIQQQHQYLTQDFAQRLKQQGFNDEMIHQALNSEKEELKKRAESQVRVSLILEQISSDEKVTVTPDMIDAEIKKTAESMNLEEKQIRDYYKQNPQHQQDLEYRVKENQIIDFLVKESKVKEV